MIINIFNLFLVIILVYLEIVKGVNFIIEECPGREVSHIRSQAEKNELSVVFYYTSWLQESLAAREVLNHVAHYYYDQIFFSTINCWHFECNCSRTHTTGTGIPHVYPTMMVYYGGRIKVEYHGEWTFASIARFLNSLYKPVERVHNKRELKLLSSESDAVVLGLFPHSNCMEYRKFVAAAVRWLEIDPEKSFRYAVSFEGAAESILGKRKNGNLSSKLPQIMLINGRGIEVFNASRNSKLDSNQIIMWVQSELKRGFSRVSSGYSNPSSLAMQLRQGRPGLVIVANDYDSYGANFYAILEKAMDNSRTLRSPSMSCRTIMWSSHHSSIDGNLLQVQSDNFSYKKEFLCLHNLQYFYTLNNYLKNVLASFRPKVSDGINSAAKLLELYESNKCLRHLYHTQYKTPAKKIAITKFLKKNMDKLWSNSSVLSLSSPHNRTLFVSILDANKYADLLTALGIENAPQSAATVFIADPKKENIFVMQSQFSYGTLLEFVKNYYENNLITTHKMSSQYNQLTLPSSMNSIYMPNLNRQMFLNAVQQQNITTVVLLYSPECAFSVIMSQVLIQISAMLTDVDNDIKFIRLNTQSNDLPWEFVMPRTPTLMVFPRGRAVESRTFPAHLKIDIRNVFGFILAQLEPIDQVKVALSSCKRSMSTLRLQKCLQFAKTLVMQHIGEHLKFWQIFVNERSFLLERLKQFKDFSLDIQRGFRL